MNLLLLHIQDKFHSNAGVKNIINKPANKKVTNLNVTYSCPSINKQFTQNKKYTNVKITIFLHVIFHNSDLFRSVLIILRELLNISY